MEKTLICEICDQEINDQLKSCNHPKNGYCALFADKKPVYKTLAELEPGDTFRYKGSDEEDWHTVSAVDDTKVYYPGYLPDKPESNYRTENVTVILK